MRLICPNCGAQYEVPDEVIPVTGRDVQCSDCGNTWFQYHPDHFPAEADTPPEPEAEWPEPAPEQDWPDPETALPPDTDASPGTDTEADVPPRSGEASDTPDSGIPANREAEDDDAYFPDEFEAPDTSYQGPTRRELDPAIRDILREEAAREERARQSEMDAGLETQQDLGLDAHDTDTRRRSEESRARMARLRGLPETDPEQTTDPEDTDPPESIDPASRRNLLPDIEEINSSLGPDRVREEHGRTDRSEGPEPGEGKSAFRSGFRIAVVLSVVALMLYVFAPRLVDTVPALAGPLGAYVDLVNAGRTGLKDMVEALAGSLTEAE